MANLRTRTATFLATITALILVLAFGNGSYQSWVNHHASGRSLGDLFLQALAWPHWTFNSHDSVRAMVAADLTAILVVLLTWVFVLFVGRGPWSGLRGGIGHFLHGWAAYIFAASFAALIGALIAHGAHAGGAVLAATGGAAYALVVGWIVGLVTLAADG
ncbi:MAG TPA: hypothetical protein VGJ28_18855 [Micromonosporaceae bacterium]|jgi:hypothetical protein